MFNGKGVIDVDIPIFFVCVYVWMYVCGYVMYVCVCMYVSKLDMVRTAITQTRALFQRVLALSSLQRGD